MIKMENETKIIKTIAPSTPKRLNSQANMKFKMSVKKHKMTTAAPIPASLAPGFFKRMALTIIYRMYEIPMIFVMIATNRDTFA